MYRGSCKKACIRIISGFGFWVRKSMEKNVERASLQPTIMENQPANQMDRQKEHEMDNQKEHEMETRVISG